MANASPPAIDVSDFQFKLQCRLKVFQNENNEEFHKSCSLVASASRYGLVFVGTASNNFQVIQIQDIEASEKEVASYPRRIVNIPSKPLHISVNCDSTKLSVVIQKDECAVAIIYNVLSFLKQQIEFIQEIRLSATPGVNILETDWNPAIPDIFTACKSDGSLGVYEFKNSQLDIHELPAAAAATCFCWSPKGKQIAVGSRDGKIMQYKPDLKAVKAVSPPPLQGSPSIISLKWISSFQFVGIYKADDPESQASLIVVDAPKTGNPVYTNYEDICYSYGTTRLQQFYMALEPNWNVLTVTSSNSMEVGVMGVESNKWVQWMLADNSRAELPLSATKQDSFPIGVSYNVGTTKVLQNGEINFPPSPMLLLLSHFGVLCCFYAINTKPGIPSVISSPEPVSDKSGLSLFIKEVIPVVPSVKPNIIIKPQVTEIPPQPKPVTPVATPPQTVYPQAPQPVKTQSLFSIPSSTPGGLFGQNVYGVKSQPSLLPEMPAQPLREPPPSLFTAPPAIILKQPESSLIGKPQTVLSEKPVAPKPSIPELTANKDQKVATPVKSDGRLPIQIETEAMIGKYIRDECITLEVELKALLQRGNDIKLKVGNEGEAAIMAEHVIKLEQFVNALKETSATQEAEIHSLKQNVIQTWAWYEDARSRFMTSQDPMLVALLQARPLDPASQRQLEDINHLIYYLESQLMQANRTLDEQWDNFQDSLSKTKRMQIPTMEAIYQSMVRQNAILQKQRYVLKDIANRVKTSNKNQSNMNILISLNATDDLEEQLRNLQLHPEATPQIQYGKILERQKKLTKSKSKKLYEFLRKREVPHISVNKPQLNNSTIHLTTLLATPLSPIAKELHSPVRSDFIMSTPKPQEKTFVAAKKEESSFAFSMPPFNKTKEILDPRTAANISKSNLLGNNTMRPASPQVSSSNLTFSFKPDQISGSNFAATSTPRPPVTKGIFTAVTTSSLVTQGDLFAPQTKPSVTFMKNVSSTAGDVKSSMPFTNFTSISSMASSATNTTQTTASSGVVIVTVTKPITTTQILVIPKSTISTQAPSVFGNYDTIKTALSPKTTSNLSSFGTSITPVITSAESVVSSSVNVPSVQFSKTPASGIFSTPVTVIKPAPPVTAPFLPDANKALPNLSATAPKSNIRTPMPTFSLATTSVFSGTIISIPGSTPGIDSKIDSVSLFKTTTSTKANTSSTIVTTTVSSPIVTVVPTSLTSEISSSSQLIFGVKPTTAASTFGTTTVSSTTPATTSSIFGTSTQGSLFGSPSSNTTKGSIFGGTPTTSSATPTQGSIFGTAASTASTTQSSVFGGTTITPPTYFGAPSSSAPIFGTSTPTSLAPAFSTSATTAQGSIFAATPTTNQTTIFGGTTTPEVFGSTPATTQPPGFVTSTSSVPQTPVFTATTTTQSSNFVGSTATTTEGSIFGGTSNTTTQGSIFGGSTNTAFGSKPTFGAPTAATSTPTSAFSSTQSNSVFGAPTTAFGSNSPFATTKASPFGTPVSTSGSLFGQPSAFGGGSIFGGTPATTSANVFGGNTSTNTYDAQNTNVFASNSNTTASSPFGGTNTAFGSSAQNSSPFGATPTSPPFGQTNQSNTFGFANKSTFGGTFGNGNNSGGFGFNTLNVGATTPTSSSSGFGTAAFGQTNQNPFSRNTGTEQKPLFSGGSVFGAPATTTSASVFGTPATTASSIFGGSSPFNKPATAFGSPPAFGSAPAFGGQLSTYGQSFGSTFGNSAQGSFSATGQAVQQTGFGSPAFQKPATAFGSPPVFGQPTPAFGSSPSFGGTPAFGTGTSFASPQKVFGGTPTDNAFGNVPQNSTFGNLANQNTLGFGNLAQQAGSPAPASFSGGSSFSSWR